MQGQDLCYSLEQLAARPFSGLMSGFLKAAAAATAFSRLLQEFEQGSAALMSRSEVCRGLMAINVINQWFTHPNLAL